MNTYKRYFFVVALIFAIGCIVTVGTVTATEEPIWRNFINEKTLSGTLPSEANPNTAPIWQAQVEAFQKAVLSERDDRQAFPVALDVTKPIWCEQRLCS